MARTAGKGGSSNCTSAGDRKRELMKKLSLLHDSSLITTHQELQPILAALDFFPGELLQPPPPFEFVNWQTYKYNPMGSTSPRMETERRGDQIPPIVMKLPYPKFDGLHRYTYNAFLEALEFYLHPVGHTFDIGRTDVTVIELHEKLWKIDESDQNDRYMYTPIMLDTETINMIYADADVIDDENNGDPLLGSETPSDESIGSSTTP